MHELSICHSILSQVEPIARERGAVISVIHLQVGPLSGIEAPLLRDCWTIARRDTPASGAQLEVEEMSITIECTACGRRGAATPNRMACNHCGEWRTRLISGDEMLIKSVELKGVEIPETEKSDV